MTHVVARIAWLLLLSLIGTAGVVFLLLFPSLYSLLIDFVPEGIRVWWVEECALTGFVTYVVARRLVPSGRGATGVARQVRGGLARIGVLMNRAWNGGLTMALGLVCVGFLAAWVPHYLTWPWSRDEDTFATLALSWEHGILPYRDIRAFNFPGHTYLFWGLGKIFGWGRTVPFYAFDASCVVLLGGVLVAWSRRRLGGALPGLVGYLVFLKSYLSFAFETTGERDWHTAFLVCLGLMIAQAWPGRLSRVASALTAALALSIRPHAILFLPALAAAVAEGGPSLRSTPYARFRFLEWVSWLGLFLAMVFAPLVAAGITADWFRSLAVPAYGGPYSTVTPASAVQVFLNQLRDWKTVIPLAATFLLATYSSGGLRRTARTWSLAWLGVLVYRPVHPAHHGYLIHPILLVGSITWALVASQIVSIHWLSRPVRVCAGAHSLRARAQPPLDVRRASKLESGTIAGSWSDAGLGPARLQSRLSPPIPLEQLLCGTGLSSPVNRRADLRGQRFESQPL